MRSHWVPWVSRLVRRLLRARQQEEDRLILELIQRRGARLTDSLEREIANRLLEFGIRKGDVVATFMYNSVAQALIWFGCAKIGAIYSSLNVSLVKDDLSYSLNDCGASLLVLDEELAPAFNACRAKLTRDLQLFVYGSAASVQDAKALPFVVVTSNEYRNQASFGAIRYTTDGSDPRNPAALPSGTAIAYSTPVSLNTSQTLKARLFANNVWSPITSATFVVGTVVNNVMVWRDTHGNEFSECPTDAGFVVQIGGVIPSDVEVSLAEYAKTLAPTASAIDGVIDVGGSAQTDGGD